MNSRENAKAVLRATVRLPRRGCRGVLIPGGFILTAAHCVHWETSGAMATGEWFVEEVRPRSGPMFRLSVYAVDPVSDVAVLGEADSQELPDDAERFGRLVEATARVRLNTDDLEIGKKIRLRFLTRRGRWATAIGERFGLPGSPPHATLHIRTNTPIRDGCSGGPVIDATGRLVGLVSFSRGDKDEEHYKGTIVRPHLALPAWIWRRIQADVTPAKERTAFVRRFSELLREGRRAHARGLGLRIKGMGRTHEH